MLPETTTERSGGEGRAASVAELDAIFRARSVAVLGVTQTPDTVPHDIFVNLLDSRFNGVVYPVAPRKMHIAGVREYDYVVDIPDPVDLAILVFPSAVCEKALLQCVEEGIKAAVIISAGFREVGAVGAARERHAAHRAELPRRNQYRSGGSAERQFRPCDAGLRPDRVSLAEWCTVHRSS